MGLVHSSGQEAASIPGAKADGLVVSVSHNRGGYDAISTIYAYYTAEQKAEHGKHCEWWTCFSNHYPVGQERAFIDGKFGSYLISWTGCE